MKWLRYFLDGVRELFDNNIEELLARIFAGWLAVLVGIQVARADSIAYALIGVLIIAGTIFILIVLHIGGRDDR